MSQVYRSKEHRVEGRDLDPKIGKSCILESHMWTRIGRALKSQNLYSFLESSHVRKRVGHVVNRVSLCLFVRFRF